MASTSNQAVYLSKIKHFEIREHPLAPPKAGEVMVGIKSVGVCGSDVHYWQMGRIGNFIVEAPMIIGHEASGVVTVVGSEVTHLEVGDRVALEPGVSCQLCHHCKTGKYNLCHDMKFHATPPVHGSLAQFINHPAHLAFKLPPNVSLEEGAVIEPASVAIHACRRADIKPGMTVLITGAGPIGLVNLLVARAFGSIRIIITDVTDDRLAFAAALGGEGGDAGGKKSSSCTITTLNVKDRKPSEVVELLGGPVADVSIDCAGFNDTLNLCLAATRSGGKVVLVGMGCSGSMTVPLVAASIREVDVLGSFRYRDTYPTCIKLLESGAIDVKPLITNRIDLSTLETFTEERVTEGFRLAAAGGGVVKVMFQL